VESYKAILQLKHEAAVLVLTRQNIPTLDRTKYAPASGVARGAYILADSEGGNPQVILIGTGSELSLCADAYEKLKADGVRARVVSMPSWDLFERQDQSYRDEVLPPDITARVAVEAGSTIGWAQFVGLKGQVIGMKTFGASGPLKDVMKKFGFTVDNVVKTARELVAK
jgi:transketolase